MKHLRTPANGLELGGTDAPSAIPPFLDGSAGRCPINSRVSGVLFLPLYPAVSYNLNTHNHFRRGETAMPFYEKGDVRIHYEEAGSGFPLLVIPGGGLNSTV